jgi:hypothetical protein
MDHDTHGAIHSLNSHVAEAELDENKEWINFSSNFHNIHTQILYGGAEQHAFVSRWQCG